MDKQLIISIGREYGSGGHEIGVRLAERFGLPLYDHNLLDEIVSGSKMNAEKMAKYDERAHQAFWSRTVRGYSDSPIETVAQIQFDFLKEKAASGESFVIVGRCAETVLKGSEGLVTFFVLGDYGTKLERIMKRRDFSAKEAALAIERHDRNRKAYHNRYSDRKWGDSRNYDLCINSSRLGIEGTADVLEKFIRAGRGEN